MKLTLSQKVWVRYDQLEPGKRFMMFFLIFAVPYGLLSGFFNMTVGVLYGVVLIIWRHLTMKYYKKELAREDAIG